MENYSSKVRPDRPAGYLNNGIGLVAFIRCCFLSNFTYLKVYLQVSNTGLMTILHV